MLRVYLITLLYTRVEMMNLFKRMHPNGVAILLRKAGHRLLTSAMARGRT